MVIGILVVCFTTPKPSGNQVVRKVKLTRYSSRYISQRILHRPEWPNGGVLIIANFLRPPKVIIMKTRNL